MAIGDSGILDAFTGADENPLSRGGNFNGPIFVGDGRPQLASNRVDNPASGFHETYWTTSFNADQECFITLAASSVNSTLYLLLNIVSPNTSGMDQYELSIDFSTSPDTWTIRRYDNAAGTVLGATFTQNVGAGDSIGFRREGNDIVAYYRASGGGWTELARRTDTTYMSGGFVGFGLYDTTPGALAVDDFGGGNNVDDVREQEGFRFGADDGSESAHTFLAAQDTNLTRGLGSSLLVRMLVNVTLGDPAATAYTLRYQKNGAGGYVSMPVGPSVAEAYGTVTFGAIGTGANGTTTVAPSYPTGITAGQYLVLVVTSGATNSETPTTPSGWTFLATGASTDGTFGIDTGPRRVTVFGRVADGTETGTVTVSITNGNTCRGSIMRFTRSGSGAWVVSAQGGDDSSSGTGFSATLASMNWNTGDATVVAVGQRVDSATQSAQSLTASGVTFGTRTNRTTTAVTTGNDHRHVIDTFAAITGTNNVNAAPTWAFTGSAAVSGGVVVVRLREYTAPVTNEIYVATSSNIAAGGEATTARLTAPSSKTTSDFTIGRRWGDENGTDTIDIAALDYTEVEWSLNTQSPAVNGDYYDLRVYAGGSALNTYTVTPRLTIGASEQTVTPSLIAAGEQTFAPTLTKGTPQTVTPNLVAAGEQTFAPTLTKGTPQTVTPNLVAAGEQTFAPTLTAAFQTIAPSLVVAGEQAFAPTLTKGTPQTVTPSLIAAGEQTFAPTLTKGTPQTVTPGLIVAGEQTFAPTVSIPSGQTVTPSLIVASDQTFAPTLTKGTPKTISFRVLRERDFDRGLRFYGGGNASNVDKLYIACNPADTINVGQGDFTVELWVRVPASLPGGGATAGANYSWINSPIIFDRDLLGSVGSGGDWGVSMTDGRVTFGLENSTGVQRTIIGTSDLRDNRWHHIAVTRQRSSGDMAVYVDGAREASFAGGPSGDVHVASNSATSTYNRYMCVGGEKHALDWPDGQWSGWVDEVRVSSVLRYTGTSYTVPGAPFHPDGATAGLFHLNEGTGTTAYDEISGQSATFTVGALGPVWVLSDAVPQLFPATLAIVPGQTITPSLIAAGEQTFAPTLTKGTPQTITPSLIAAGEQTFAPTLTKGTPQTITPSLIAAGEQTFAPTLTKGTPQTVTPGLIVASEQTFAPTLTKGTPQTITPSLIVAGEQTFAPTLTKGTPQTITPGLIVASDQTFAPTVSIPSGQTVTPGLVAASEQTFAPTLTKGTPQTVTPGLIVAGEQTFAPSVSTFSGQAVTPALISEASELYAPTLTLGAPKTVVLNKDQVGPDDICFPPTLTLGAPQTVTPSLIAAGEQTFAPTLTKGTPQTVTPSLIAAGEQTFAPTLAASFQAVTPSLIAAGERTFAPTLTLGAPQTVTPSLIAAGEQTFAPTLTKGTPQTVTPGLIVAGEQTFAPTLTTATYFVQPSFIPEAGVFYPLIVVSGPALVVTPSLVPDASTFFAPTLTYGVAQVIALDAPPSADAAVYAPTLTVLEWTDLAQMSLPLRVVGNDGRMKLVGDNGRMGVAGDNGRVKTRANY